MPQIRTQTITNAVIRDLPKRGQCAPSLAVRRGGTLTGSAAISAATDRSARIAGSKTGKQYRFAPHCRFCPVPVVTSTIVTAAKADPIVMAAQRAGLADFLLGDNAYRVVRRYPHSVMVVRP